jgi:hypothetical protein
MRPAGFAFAPPSGSFFASCFTSGRAGGVIFSGLRDLVMLRSPTESSAASTGRRSRPRTFAPLPSKRRAHERSAMRRRKSGLAPAQDEPVAAPVVGSGVADGAGNHRVNRRPARPHPPWRENGCFQPFSARPISIFMVGAEKARRKRRCRWAMSLKTRRKTWMPAFAGLTVQVGTMWVGEVGHGCDPDLLRAFSASSASPW